MSRELAAYALIFAALGLALWWILSRSLAVPGPKGPSHWNRINNRTTPPEDLE